MLVRFWNTDISVAAISTASTGKGLQPLAERFVLGPQLAGRVAVGESALCHNSVSGNRFRSEWHGNQVVALGSNHFT